MIQPTDLLVVQRDGTTCRATAVELQELLGRPLCSATAGRLWDLNSTPADNDWRAVCWAPELNLFVAVSIDGSQRVMTSSDGLRWTPRRTPPDNNSWIGVCWSPELRLLVAVASNGSSNRVMTSSDGITWTARRVPLNNNWVAICWSPRRRPAPLALLPRQCPTHRGTRGAAAGAAGPGAGDAGLGSATPRQLSLNVGLGLTLRCGSVLSAQATCRHDPCRLRH